MSLQKFAPVALGLAFSLAPYGCGYKAPEYIKASQLPGDSKRYNAHVLETIGPPEHLDSLIAILFEVGNKKLEFGNPNDYTEKATNLSLREASKGLQEPHQYQWVRLKDKNEKVVAYGFLRKEGSITFTENGTLKLYVEAKGGEPGGGGGGGGGGGAEGEGS